MNMFKFFDFIRALSLVLVLSHCTDTGASVSTLSPIQTTETAIPSLSCDFEKNNLCGWTSHTSTGVNTAWKVDWGVSRSYFGPKVDHTIGGEYGHYALLFHSNNDPFYYHINSRKGVMSVTNNGVPGTGANTPFCLILWYYMETTDYVELNVTVSAPDNSVVNVETRENGQGEKWHMLQMEAPGDKNGYVYTISAFAKIGQVSIDDISVKHQSCQSP